MQGQNTPIKASSNGSRKSPSPNLAGPPPIVGIAYHGPWCGKLTWTVHFQDGGRVVSIKTHGNTPAAAVAQARLTLLEQAVAGALR